MSERKVILAVDDSKYARFAFQWFFDNVYRKGDFVLLTHVPEQASLSMINLKEGLNLPAAEWKDKMESHISKFNKLIEGFEQELIHNKIHYEVVCEQHRKPGEGIIQAAEGKGANMIVIGTHGYHHGTVRRALVGSVSDYVIRHSHVPVVVCPVPPE